MSTSLKNFVNSHPTVTLSHTDYGRHFHLGKGVNIPSFPTQRLQTFVETEGLPYRFVVVGQLMSFKVVEDSVCGLKNLKEHHSHAIGFTGIFSGQLLTLQDIEEVDRTDEAVQTQVAPLSRRLLLNGELIAYNVSNHSLSSADIGSFILAVVELRCLDVSCSPTTFFRTYWIEAITLRTLTSHTSLDEEYVKNIIDRWGTASHSNFQ